MVKKGPCHHCGIDYTPLWRNGPEDKPVLCNACGSRYRLWGTLKNYLPKHCQPEYQLNNPKKVKGRSNLSVLGGMSLWNFKIPSRKRSLVVYKKMTQMEKFERQLLNVLKYDMRPNYESFPEEEALFLHNLNNFIPSNEIGLGGMLLKPDGTSA